MRRWHPTFWLGLAASAALTALLWWAGVPGGAVLLLSPFLWLPRRRGPPARTCPACGFASSDQEVRFCPRDGTALE